MGGWLFFLKTFSSYHVEAFTLYITFMSYAGSGDLVQPVYLYRAFTVCIQSRDSYIVAGCSGLVECASGW